MKKLTRGQRFALAREARRLAMECVEGTAPEFGVDSYCGCAVGVMLFRALGVSVQAGSCDDFRSYRLAVAIDQHLPDPTGLGVVSRALQSQRRNVAAQRDAVVFPLLALADALEASAVSARKRPQKQPPEVP